MSDKDQLETTSRAPMVEPSVRTLAGIVLRLSERVERLERRADALEWCQCGTPELPPHFGRDHALMTDIEREATADPRCDTVLHTHTRPTLDQPCELPEGHAGPHSFEVEIIRSHEQRAAMTCTCGARWSAPMDQHRPGLGVRHAPEVTP
jgi:hypothetical protein